MRRCPNVSRCRVAERPPFQFVATSDGVVDPVVDRVSFRAELRQHDTHPLLAGHPLHPTDDLDAPHVFQLVEDELHHVAAAGRSAIAVLADQRLDTSTGIRGDSGTPVDDLGDGRDRHPGGLRDVGDRHRLDRFASRAFGIGERCGLFGL
jgi:hypothetical protein